MSEFNNRISAQRDIVSCVNNLAWKEELFGLSRKAIDRWASSNKISCDSTLLLLIEKSADKLFFLSNKSQEQVSDEYRLLSKEVAELTENIRREIKLRSQSRMC